MILVDLNSLNLSKEAEDLLNDLDDMTPLLKRLGQAAQRMMSEKFRQEGPGWAELADSTLDRRRKDGKGAQILRDTGRLFLSLTDSNDGSVYELTDKMLVLGTNLKYAAVHQFGSRDQRIPARPFMPDPSELAPMFSRVIERYFRDRGHR